MQLHVETIVYEKYSKRNVLWNQKTPTLQVYGWEWLHIWNAQLSHTVASCHASLPVSEKQILNVGEKDMFMPSKACRHLSSTLEMGSRNHIGP